MPISVILGQTLRA